MKRAGLWVGIAVVFGVVAFTPASAVAEDMEPSYICVEAETGMVLAESNADTVRPPASVVKLMIMLLVSEGIDAGTWTLETPIVASKQAEGMGGTQVFLKAGEEHTVGELMNAVAVASANDAAMAIAEGLFGSKDDCLKRMNERAAELGMASTHYRSVHGLPPDTGEEFDEITARDLSILARECVKSPFIMSWVNQKEFTFRPGEPVRSSTNKLLWRMQDCDGLKTGYIRAAKFCIAATAQRGGLRLIAIVLGHPSKYGRFNLAEDLMEEGFQRVCKVRAATKGDTVVAKSMVRDAQPDVGPIEATIGDDVYVVVNKNEVELLEFVQEIPDELVAPIHKGDELGTLVVQLSGVPLGETPLISSVDVEAAPFMRNRRASGAEGNSTDDESWSTRAWRSLRALF